MSCHTVGSIPNPSQNQVFPLENLLRNHKDKMGKKTQKAHKKRNSHFPRKGWFICKNSETN